MALNKFEWKNGTKVEPARVNIGGESYEVTDAQYEGETPLSSANLNLMQDTLLGNVKDDLEDETKIASVKAVKQIYSTDEVKTNKVWLGKPVYRKVINFGALPNNTSKQVNHNISNLEAVITISGFCYTSSSVFYPLPLQFKGSDSNYNVEMNVTSTYVGMISNTNRSNYSAYVILEYTKI